VSRVYALYYSIIGRGIQPIGSSSLPPAAGRRLLRYLQILVICGLIFFTDSKQSFQVAG
jgi:hypothetical protein